MTSTVRSRISTGMAAAVLVFGLSTTLHAQKYVKGERPQQRGYSLAVITEGGRTVWLGGQIAVADDAGKSLAGDFEGQVRQVFKLSKSGTVAGCMISSGNIGRTAKVRLLRDGIIVWNGRIGSLRRFKEDVREVATGFECGIALDGMNDLKVGDVIEAYTIEELARTL